ncbi:hypothetical protein [Actinomyces bowdenii]|uniref:Uncharacterized protein n=1 Tax=Actinomyces bowdenii TaxID=131109 RepID=A0A3P1V7G4_9ACTO|nr:hypothetical protein [Actinomyces bowdenii]RRD29285.1 hypothetical protein EII10_07195 [Actinomyces bowdenii]
MSRSATVPLFRRLRRTKAALLAVSLTFAGVLLMMLNAWLSTVDLGSWSWLHALPLGELGGTLFGAGLLSTLFEYTFRRDQEEAVAERFRQIIGEQAPAMRDAVIEAFRFQRSDLERIATPQLLDDLAATSLGLRFGDTAFGQEVYADIRHQAMSAQERWHDARIDATLGIPRVRSCAPYPFLDLVVRWEYGVIPRHRFRKFAVVSDRARYEDLAAQRGETSVWYRRPAPGFKVNDLEMFALEQFTINGHPVPFERHSDEVSQVYVVDLGKETISQGEEVVVAFRFRVRVPRDGHTFHLAIDRPTKGLDAALSYDPQAVDQVSLMDFASRGEGGRISEEPDNNVIRYRYDGWLFPRAGLVFAWSLPADQAPQHGSDTVPPARGQNRNQPARRATEATSQHDSARPATAA